MCLQLEGVDVEAALERYVSKGDWQKAIAIADKKVNLISYDFPGFLLDQARLGSLTICGSLPAWRDTTAACLTYIWTQKTFRFAGGRV